MNINEVVQCAWMMRQAAENLHFVSKRLQESASTMDSYRASELSNRASELSVECSRISWVFRRAGWRCLGQDIFDAQVQRLEQEVKPFEIY